MVYMYYVLCSIAGTPSFGPMHRIKDDRIENTIVEHMSAKSAKSTKSAKFFI